MESWLILCSIIVLVGILWLIRKYSDGGWCYSTVRLDGKTVIITGANTGIGKETAKDIARRGARVILACRDVTKAESAAIDICRETGNTNVVVRKIDLASLESIRQFASRIVNEEKRLDILINNAGIMMCPEWKTDDGFEMQFGVNHLGHFLLTNLLLDLLKSCAPSRIVTVSSLGHKMTRSMPWDNLQTCKSYNRISAYAISKVANILFTKELSKRLQGTGVNAYALHPGSVNTDLPRHMFSALWSPFILPLKIAILPIGLLLTKSPRQGAQTSIHCAVAEELKDRTGIYLSDCVVTNPSSLACDDVAAHRLWKLSADMVNLDKKVD